RDGVELPADRVELLRDLARRSALGSLEEQVFDEVGDPRIALRLIARAGIDPDSQRDGVGVRHRLADDADAVGEGVEVASQQARSLRDMGGSVEVWVYGGRRGDSPILPYSHTGRQKAGPADHYSLGFGGRKRAPTAGL